MEVVAAVLDSVLFYLGATIATIGALSLAYPLWFLGVATRSAAGFVLGAGLLLSAAALSLPVTEKRIARRVTLLDEAMPVWQFDERHAIEVRATRDRIYNAIRAVTPGEIFLFLTLTAIRRFGRPGPESILNAPEKLPLLEIATRTTFVLLADEPSREIVVGTIVGGSPELRAAVRLNRNLFYGEPVPGLALAAVNYLITPHRPGRCAVTTETRVYANTRGAARRFATYWRIIHPGSDILRRTWLRAVKRRAEAVTEWPRSTPGSV